MNQYVDAVADIITHLDLAQVSRIANQLNVVEMNTLYFEITPQIKDLPYRRSLRSLLAKYAHDPSLVTRNMSHNQPLTDPPMAILNTLIQSILTTLSDPIALSSFIQTAQKEELFTVLIYLRKHKNTPHEAQYTTAIEQALDKQVPHWRKQHASLEFDPVSWKKIIDGINSIRHEIHNRPSGTKQNQPPPVTNKSFFEKIGQAFKLLFQMVFHFFVQLFTKTKPKQVVKKSNPTWSLNNPMSASELAIYGQMHHTGATHARTSIGRDILGNKVYRNRQSREDTIMSRFAIALASQMISGTKGNGHTQLMSISNSLAESNDTKKTMQLIHEAVSDSTIPSNPFSNGHIFSSSGDDALVTAIESQNIDQILATPDAMEQYGLHFSDEDKANLAKYKANTDRSIGLNYAIYDFANSWGGYEEAPNGGYKKIENGYDAAQMEYENKLSALSNAVLNECDRLKEGESLYLDTGLEGHAMKLSIKRIEGRFTLTCYDPSGGLENSTLSTGLSGLLQLAVLPIEAKRSNALSFSVSQERLLSQEGLHYFNDLIRQHSYGGWAQNQIENKFSYSSRQERETLFGWNILQAYRNQAQLYLYYIRKFTAIADPETPPSYSELLQRPQNTNNCFAKRLQTSQLYELGKPTYKKLRLAILIEQKKALLDDVFGQKALNEPPFVSPEYVDMLKSIQPELLSPHEVHELSKQLCEIKTTPSKAYYNRFFTTLLSLHEKCSPKKNSTDSLVSKRIERKIEQYAKTYFDYLNSRKSMNVIKQTFSPEFIQSKGMHCNWDSGEFPLKRTKKNVCREALDNLSEYATAQAWKASIQLINHQIMKLRVNERHIQYSSEALSHANYTEASSKVRLHDLEGANIVTRMSAVKRIDDLKIELNVGGERKQIDKDTFFRLVIDTPKALTNSHVMSLLDYLRNASPEIEKRFYQQVYPFQHRAFKTLLGSLIKQSTNKLLHTVNVLSHYEKNIDIMLTKCYNKRQNVIDSIKTEEQIIGPGKRSLKLKCAEALNELILKDIARLEQLKRSISTKRNTLSASHTVAGSANNIISNASARFDRISADPLDPKTTKVIITEFVNAQYELSRLEETIQNTINAVKMDDLEMGFSAKATDMSHYRRKVITECLRANPDYLIINELVGLGKHSKKKPTTGSDVQSKRNENNSLTAAIQHINQTLRNAIEVHFEREMIAQATIPDKPNYINALLDEPYEYNAIAKYAQTLTSAPIPQAIKNQWVHDLFQIWLKHDDPEVLIALQSTNDNDLVSAINLAFHHFIERNTPLKRAALNAAHYPIQLSKSQLDELGWKPIREEDIKKTQSKRSQAATVIKRTYKRYKINKALTVAQKSSASTHDDATLLTPDDIEPLYKPNLPYKNSINLTVPFFTQPMKMVLSSNIITFLKDHNTPSLTDVSPSACMHYFNEALAYLSALKQHYDLENKRERLIEFCISNSAIMFNLPYPPPVELVTEIQATLLDGYRNAKGGFDDAFLTLENTERSQLLSTLLKLTLSPMKSNNKTDEPISTELFSLIKQWERLIIPADVLLSKQISLLKPGGTKANHIRLLKEVDNALHASPVGLEGLYEGQKGLQMALTRYGQETNVDWPLRKLADRLLMRNGSALLPIQFITYYTDRTFLLSEDGIGSTQGRECFSRGFLDAHQHANPKEKLELMRFLNQVLLECSRDTAHLKTPHAVFLDELQIQCRINDPDAFSTFQSSGKSTASMIGSKTGLFIDRLTSNSSKNAEDRLFGFAKEINWLSWEIAFELKTKNHSSTLDRLYSRLICARFAYQLLFDQATSEVITNLNQNFEYKKEMALVQTNINQWQENLVLFSNSLIESNHAVQFSAIFNEYHADHKFEDQPPLETLPCPFDIPGFINLGNNRRLDILHGALYIGNDKQGLMPIHLKSHYVLAALSIQTLPFKRSGDSYVYVQDQEIKASITPLNDGRIIIQRELKTLDKQIKMLQYLLAEETQPLPRAIKQRINATHFFIDSDGAIHAYSANFTPMLKLSPNHAGEWVGQCIDHHGDTIPIHITAQTEPSCLSEQLVTILPYDEMLPIDQNTVYIPALNTYVVRDHNHSLFLTNTLSAHGRKRLLTIKPNGVAYTEKVPSATEMKEIDNLNKAITELQAQRTSIQPSDLLSAQKWQQIRVQIKEYEANIKLITLPHYFMFAPDSNIVKNQEEQCQTLKKDMEKAYQQYLCSRTTDQESHAGNYSTLKARYLEKVALLKQTQQDALPILSYHITEDGHLIPEQFQGILHLGMNPKKHQLVLALLSQRRQQVPFSPDELGQLRYMIDQLNQKTPLTIDDITLRCMLIGFELQHHLLNRAIQLSGQRIEWDREAYQAVLNDFSDGIKKLHHMGGKPPLDYFRELWRELKSEFESDKALLDIFKPEKIVSLGVQRKPLTINTRTTNMPIETIEAKSLIQFQVHRAFQSLMDPEQLNLQKRLQQLVPFQESIQAQENGFYYEHFGIFNIDILSRLLNTASNQPGIGGLSQTNVESIFNWLSQQGWIKAVNDMEQFQLVAHPCDFFSAPKLAGFLSEMGLNNHNAHTVIERLNVFLYETAVNGGVYSLKPGAQIPLTERITSAQSKFNIEVLQARDIIKSILEKASKPISFSELNTAFLLDDYSRITTNFPIEEHVQVETALNNAMTRMLFYKTELDHLNDASDYLQKGNIGKAIAMLHVKRNYQLDRLLDNPDMESTNSAFNREQDRKMQRAFLLFESEFGHRCTIHQVNVFRGLLIDDETNPEKIDAAQARMGFGKTSLLPLVALYKTGEKLVRFIVPKSGLETNTTDMSLMLTKLLGSRAVKDDFHRYKIDIDDELHTGEKSRRLQSIRDAKADLKKRLALYQLIQANGEVLVQAPHVRNALECQLKIFIDLLLKTSEIPDQETELIECISILNEIRSLPTISVFDELDATQNPTATDVNYTSGEKVSILPHEIHPLELITRTIRSTEDRTVHHLAHILLTTFGIMDPDKSIFKFITSLETKEPVAVSQTNPIAIYLIRAILTNASLLNLFTEKEPSTDFGAWFQNSDDGSKLYDYSSENTHKTARPLLIAVPYSAANTPKPKGSRFDNPEVTAIATLLYYLDPRTTLQADPHLEFIINAIRNGHEKVPFLDLNDTLVTEFADFLKKLKDIAEIEDDILRNAARNAFFKDQLSTQASQEVFRRMLARSIVYEQVKFDDKKANSNRYEQGNVNDIVIGFSGTAGDAAFYFNHIRLDPATDGSITLGIMGRKNCQKTIPLATRSYTGEYNASIIEQLSNSFLTNTRALIDVGGLCKASNRSIVKAIALQLHKIDSPVKNNGIIFYDDATNTKKLLVLHSDHSETITPLTPEMMANSEHHGSYFTYYDQAHARGADIKQMDEAHAVLTLSLTVSNNDYKQAIMRMRKMVDKSAGQSFSIAVPDNVNETIHANLKLASDHELTGNDIAYWLRQKELEEGSNDASLMITELDAVIKNTILQQQAMLTHLLIKPLSDEQMTVLRQCLADLNNIAPFISVSQNDLKIKYGFGIGTIEKQAFIATLRHTFKIRLEAVFATINHARKKIGLELYRDTDKKPYYAMEARIITKRAPRLSDTFLMPTSTTLVEVQAEMSSEVESQSESQTQVETHAFSHVNNEVVIVAAQLRKQDWPYSPASIDFLSEESKITSLPMASQTAHIQRLFHKNEQIRCSPSYLTPLATSPNAPLPPIRYFLARETGDPAVILINQDEADLFKQSYHSKWSLYDLRQLQEKSFIPIVGSPIHSLKNPLLNWMAFASFRYPFKSTSLDDVTSAFRGIYTRNDMEPALTIDYGSATEPTLLFHLTQWGMTGETVETIPLEIAPTHELYKGQFEKNGLSISVGQGPDRAEIFISSTIHHRILTQMAKATKRDSIPQKSMLQTVSDEIKAEYSLAIARKQTIQQAIAALKTEQKTILNQFAETVSALTAQQITAIQIATDQLQMRFTKNMREFLSFPRKSLSSALFDELTYYCDQENGYNGITINKTVYGSLKEAIQGMLLRHIISQRDNNAPFDTQTLTKQLDLIITTVSMAAYGEYKKNSQYEQKKGIFIDALQRALRDMYHAAPKQFLIKNISDVSIWNRPFDDAWQLHFNYTYDDNSSLDAIYECFTSAMSDCAINNTINEFENNLMRRIRSLESEEVDVGSLDYFIERLSYHFDTSTPTQYKQVIQDEIETTVKTLLLDRISELEPSDPALCKEATRILTEKIKTVDFDLPKILIDYTNHSCSPEAIQHAIQQAFLNQQVIASPFQMNSLTQECISYMHEYEAVYQQIDHYSYTDHRKIVVKDSNDKEYLVPQAVLEPMTSLDNTMLTIQKQLEEAAAQKKSQLELVGNRLNELNTMLKGNRVEVKQSRTEKSAINKVFSGVNNLIALFNAHQIAIQEPLPGSFLEEQMNLKQLLEDQPTYSTILQFTPPEFYNVAKDMDMQVIHMHGLDSREVRAKNSLDSALALVKKNATLIQRRRLTVQHTPSNQQMAAPEMTTKDTDTDLTMHLKRSG